MMERKSGEEEEGEEKNNGQQSLMFNSKRLRTFAIPKGTGTLPTIIFKEVACET